MSDSERMQQIKDVIRRHLAEVGATRWKAVRLHCPDISDATFWRYVKAVRDEAGEKLGPSAPTNGSAGQSSDGEVPCLGALPGFYNPLQKARLYESLLADAEIMRAQAVDHRGRITNWRMFEKSIQLRERLVSQQGEVMEFFQSQEGWNQFFAQIIEIVDELPKEVTIKLMERLYGLQQQRLAAAPQNLASRL
jgi:hypothetical protein